MFIRNADLPNGTGYLVSIVPLDGPSPSGQWDENSGHHLLSILNINKCCTISEGLHHNYIMEKMSMQEQDAEQLMTWIKNHYFDQ